MVLTNVPVMAADSWEVRNAAVAATSLGRGERRVIRIWSRLSIKPWDAASSWDPLSTVASFSRENFSGSPAFQMPSTRTPCGPTLAARLRMKVSVAASAGPVLPIIGLPLATISCRSRMRPARKTLAPSRASPLATAMEPPLLMTAFLFSSTFFIGLSDYRGPSFRHPHRNAVRRLPLVRNGNLLSGARPQNPRGRVPDPPLERPGKVRLIVVSDLVDGVGDRTPPLQEGRRLLGAFDLVDASPGQPRCPQEAVAHRPGRQILRSPPQRSIDQRVADQHPTPHEPLDERLRVLVAGELPCGALQPEGPTRGIGQDRLHV